MVRNICLVTSLTLVLSGMVACSRTQLTIPQQPEDTSPLQLVVAKVTVVDQTNPQTNIVFSTPEQGHVVLEIENATGYLVLRLADEDLPPGTHGYIWDTRNGEGEEVASGIYFYHLTAQSSAGMLEQRVASVLCRSAADCKDLIDEQ